MTVLICDVCSNSLRCTSVFVLHFRTHSKERPFQCRFCGIRMAQHWNLKAHEEFRCQFLNASSKGASVQTVPPCLCQNRSKCRCRRQRRDNAKSFECYNCGKRFSSFNTLRYHMGTSHLNERKQCDDCGKCLATAEFFKHATNHLLRTRGIAALSPICDVCDKTFTWFHLLHMHIKDFHNRPKSKFPCIACQKIYATYKLLQGHRCAKNIAKRFECDICDKSFSSVDGLTLHMRRTHLSKRLQCDDCGKFYTSYQGLGLHATDGHLMSGAAAASSLKCDDCEKNFLSVNYLQMHIIRDMHNSKFTCTFCQKTYGSHRKLNEHRCANNRQHSMRTGLDCDICDKKFTSKVNFTVHAAVAHVSTQMNSQNGRIMTNGRRLMLQCSKCVQLFLRKDDLTAHERRRHASREQTSINVECLRCQLCDKRFTNKSNLHQHVRNHKDPASYACSLCRRAYSMPESLKKHVRKEHSGQEKISYQCDLCDQLCVSKFGISLHAKLDHSSQQDVSDCALFQCSKCVQRCTSKSNLRSHEQRHLINKPHFLCHICDFVCSEKANLHRHELREHALSKEYFICFNCKRRFKDLAYLKVHMKNVHKALLSRTYQCDQCGNAFACYASIFQHIYDNYCSVQRSSTAKHC